jgi:ribosomal protein S18 acetylase RimI-like enzyme
LALRPATAADTGALAHILVEGFGGGEDSVRQRVALGIDDPHGPYLLGLLADTPIGAMKLYHTGAKTGIYAFSVLPRYQGQGYGRWMLSQALADLRAQGHTRTMLEVDPDNAPAIVLYRSCGFTLTTTYGYYALAVEPLAPVSP